MTEPVLNSDPIPHEIRIVWEEDVDPLDYVREVVSTFCRTRQRPVPWIGPGRRVGYSVLAQDAPNNGYRAAFVRRLFWVHDSDRSEDPAGVYAACCPAEAVDPRTVAPRTPGRLTERARGGARTAEAREAS